MSSSSYDEAREAALKAAYAPENMLPGGCPDPRAAIDAFLGALKADGYKLVRREATEEMDNATQDFDVYWAYTQDGRPGMPKDVWSAMWDAAPEPVAEALTEVKS